MGEIVDTTEAAKRLGLSASTLNKLRLTGGGPRFATLGRAIRYRVSDLDAWVAARLRENTSQPVTN